VYSISAPVLSACGFIQLVCRVVPSASSSQLNSSRVVNRAVHSFIQTMLLLHDVE